MSTSPQMDERPRERCLLRGPDSLSLRECLALVLNSGPPATGSLGLARALLGRVGEGLPEEEAERAFFTAMESNAAAHLQDLRGLGPATQARLLAAFELARRYAQHRGRAMAAIRRTPPIDDPGDLRTRSLQRISAERRSATREWLGFVPVYQFRTVGELCRVEAGVRTHVNVDPAELFARLLALRPSAFFLFHNHPSGDLTPSPQDRQLTRRVGALAEELGIRLLGHAILAPEGEAWISPGAVL
ncbi:MAG: hypothetical protein NDJ90_05855 [Oligoflexia bacterium]|nr:hypothetical protein [Oligoflexia bacterium]